jgi:predicted ABC-type ATPase
LWSVALGGHDVPTDDVLRRSARSHANLPAAASVANEIAVFDNAAPDGPVLIALGMNGTLEASGAIPQWLGGIAGLDLRA